MSIKNVRGLVGVVCLAAGFGIISGCGNFQFGRTVEFGSEWVSNRGESQEQFQRDQAECKHEANVVNYPRGYGAGGGDEWNLDYVMAFETCMRSKGWVKK